MLDWTGERFVPWAKEPAVAYEHLHRYLWVSTLVTGKRVLDLASGEGYGANFLAERAGSVLGVDIDPSAVQHAAAKYLKPNLQFLQGSITSVPVPESGSFDVIVCFEAIEHIEDQEALMLEVRRLLRPDGVFVVSTPNKDVYESGKDAGNPFHVKELTFDEFNSLITRHFPRVCYLGQRIHPGSSLWRLDGAGGRIGEITVERQDGEFRPIPNQRRVAEFFVAVASSFTFPGLEGSVLLDHSSELIAEKDRATRWFEGHVREKDEALAWRGSQIEKLNEDLAWSKGQMESLRETLVSREEALAWRSGQVESLERQKEWLSTQLQNKQKELESVYQSRAWKWVLKLRGVKRLVGL